MEELIKDDIIGYSVVTDTRCTKSKDGYWIVEQTLTQSRTKDGEDWETKKISMKATDKNLERASDITAMSILLYLERIDGDLFNEQKEDEIPEGKGGYIQ
jgi:hypothetical protein